MNLSWFHQKIITILEKDRKSQKTSRFSKLRKKLLIIVSIKYLDQNNIMKNKCLVTSVQLKYSIYFYFIFLFSFSLFILSKTNKKIIQSYEQLVKQEQVINKNKINEFLPKQLDDGQIPANYDLMKKIDGKLIAAEKILGVDELTIGIGEV